MAALNLSCCYYHHRFQSHSPPPTNVASPPILLSHRNHISISPKPPLTSFHHKRHHSNLLVLATTMATNMQEDLPPALDSTSEPPSVFDGTTRLYISYTCPYAQRVWITRNCKALPRSLSYHYLKIRLGKIYFIM
ncbi:putative Thioredoxin-like superfamily [Helianthus anomalus]